MDSPVKPTEHKSPPSELRPLTFKNLYPKSASAAELVPEDQPAIQSPHSYCVWKPRNFLEPGTVGYIERATLYVFLKCKKRLPTFEKECHFSGNTILIFTYTVIDFINELNVTCSNLGCNVALTGHCIWNYWTFASGNSSLNTTFVCILRYIPHFDWKKYVQHKKGIIV